MDISVGWDSSYLTQNDFNAARTQLHNEVVDLTNVLLYMVDGSTNMKGIIASGNSNTALALLGAASNITANLNEPNLQSTPAEVSPWNIVSMIGSGLTTAAAFGTDGLVNPADIEGLNDTVDLVADLFSDASVGGITYARSWDNAGTPFFSDWSINPIDYYIHALNFQNVGASDSYANYLSSPLATLLFTSGSGDLNFSMDAFIAHSGPMDWRLDGKGSSFLDFSIMDPNSGANLTGHNDWNICSVAYMSSGVGVGVGPGGGSNPP